MSKVSEHLFEHHKAMHQDRADAIANHEAELKKADGSESFHKAEIERHKKAMDHHADMMAECSKASQAEDLEKLNLNRLVPTQVIAVIPDNPNARANVTAVPRFGARPIPVAVETGPVDFAKLIGTDEESQHSEEVSLQKRR
jgi:hypothetical protein